FFPPDSFKYLLIGDGSASYAAATQIRAKDRHGEILVISPTRYDPFLAPPLCKVRDRATSEYSSEWRHYCNTEHKDAGALVQEYLPPKSTPPHPTGKGTKMLAGTRAVAMDTNKQTVTMDSGAVVKYQKVLIATGGKLQEWRNGDERVVSVAWTNVRDGYVALKMRLAAGVFAKPSIKLGVIGDGSLECEMAEQLRWATRDKQVQVVQVVSSDAVLTNVFPPLIAEYATRRLGMEHQVVCNSSVTALTPDPESNQIVMEINHGKSLPLRLDYVVGTVPVTPNASFAATAGVPIDPLTGGIIVNENHETEIENVYAAGAVVHHHKLQALDELDSTYLRPSTQGRTAGDAMTENHSAIPFKLRHQSWVPDWSAYVGADIRLDSFGNTDPSLASFVLWRNKATSDNTSKVTPVAYIPLAGDHDGAGALTCQGDLTPQGAVVYEQDGKIVGVTLVNNGYSSGANVRRALGEANESLAEMSRKELVDVLSKRFFS
ncbi:hypothetical protein BCR44DRAFT_1430821, partial [Catenaria anguillulae PL171]